MTPAERLLRELGITEPAEIDLEAIAFHVGVRVRKRALTGCEAHILGCADRAIITVNKNSPPRRRRFSIAHELGHWCHHRGKTLICRADEYHPRDDMSPEKVADSYAADLLMPRYLFHTSARQYARLNFEVVEKLGDVFETSLTATTIRLIEFDHTPALVISHSPTGRNWFARAPSVPRRWFPRDDLDPDSFAFGILFGDQADDRTPRKIGADAWFDRSEAERYIVYQQTVSIAKSEILTLVLITDEKMLQE